MFSTKNGGRVNPCHNRTLISKQTGLTYEQVVWAEKKGAQTHCALAFLWSRTQIFSKKCCVCSSLFIGINKTQSTCSDICSAVHIRRGRFLNRVLKHSKSQYALAEARAAFKCKHCGSISAPDDFCHNTKFCSVSCKNKYCWHQHKGRYMAQKKEKRRTDPQTKLRHRLRNRLWEMMCGKNPESAMDLLGMSIPDFKLYIQAKFQRGMAWNNWGTFWELDHILPCASFDLTDKHQRKACFHYSNFQPLTKPDNRSKGARIVSPQMSLLM